MAIKPAVRHHPTLWIIIGSMLLASVLSSGLTLLTVLGAPPWELAARVPQRPSAGPQAPERGSVAPTRSPAEPGAASATTSTELGAGAPGTRYHPVPPRHRHPEGYQRSLLFSGVLGLTIALVGVTMVSRRRRMW